MRAIYENYLRVKFKIPNGLDIDELAQILWPLKREMNGL